ncbi:helix-turn-helix domain-containing protein [Kitasatospora sp. NBC_00085]
MSDTQKRELWDRWKAGESISEISRALGRPPGSIFTIIKSNGGYVPPVRQRRPGQLTLHERESISRGLARGDSIREIARTLGRAPSTVSRVSFPRCAGGVDYLVRMGVGGSTATGSAVAWSA